MSDTLDHTLPADATPSVDRTGTTVTESLMSACGTATFGLPVIIETSGSVSFMPSGAKMRVLTNCSHGMPETRSMIDAVERVQDVVILPLRAERRRGLDVAKPPDDVRLAVLPARRPEQIGARQPAAMREEVADRELARDPWIVQLELGDVLRDGVVELELALVDEHGERRGRHRLGRRSDRKARVLVGRLRRSLLQHAVALGEDDRIVLDDRDGERGDAPLGGGLCDVLVERGPVGFGLRGERRRRRDEQRCRQPSMCMQ